jgi:hypothetical protein
MKRCPTCNQQFTDEWLTFCTQDGSSLVEVTGSSNEPPPTIAYSAPMPPSVSPLEQPTMDYPGGYKPPPVQMSSPQSMQPGWSPPPPPAYAAQPQKTMALFSMILGIVSITIGLCYFGILTGPIAIVLGIISLFQIKKDPNRYGGKGMAIAGIVTGAISFVFVALIILILGLLGASS